MIDARARVLLLAMALFAGSVVFLASTATAQDDDGVPVDFTPSSLGKAELNFWRETNDAANDETQCQVQPPDEGGIGDTDVDPTGDAFCSARLDMPPNLGTAEDPEREQYDVRQEGAVGDGDDRETAKFVMDTDGPDTDDETTLRGKGAAFDFEIRPVANAIQYQFTYDASQGCSDTGGTPLEFTMQLRRAQEPGSTGSGIDEGGVIDSSRTTRTSCGHSGSITSSSGAVQVAASVDLDDPIQVADGETLVVEIYAEPAEPQAVEADINWALFFEGAETNGRTVLRTNQVVERAIWAQDGSGAQRSTFDPDLPENQRRMTGYMALRSPFGAEAVPASGFTGSIQGPDGNLVDLDPSDGTQTNVEYDDIDGREDEDGAFKMYKFSTIAGETPWQYPTDVETGPYTIDASGEVLDGRLLEFGTTVAMGSFEFSLAPVNGESTSHNLVENATTTYLLRLANEGPGEDTYQLETAFEFGDGGSWSADLEGDVDRNGEVTLGAGEVALVRATVLPPSGVTDGDASRVTVSADSDASDSTESVTLDSQITDQVARDVTVFPGLAEDFEDLTVGVDRTDTIRLFAWNQGTATDGVQASFVNDAFDPDDPDVFRTSFPQRTFTNVEPGSLKSIPVDVTTTTEVEDGQTLEFGVEFASTSDPQASGQQVVDVTVEAVRDLVVRALDGDNDQSLESDRFGKYNITEDGGPDAGPGSAPDCESSDGAGNVYARDCRDYTNWTYHRLVVENTGDLNETVQLTEFGETSDSPNPGNFEASGSECDDVLPDRFDDAVFVDEIDHAAPGTESELDEIDVEPGTSERVFLRVGYDGQTPLFDDADNPCQWESYETTALFTVVDGDLSREISTETRIFSTHPQDGGMGPAAAEISLQALTEDPGTGAFVEVPRYSPIEPGTSDVIPFTVSLQSGHYDPVNLTLEPADLIQDLRDEGWEFEFTRIDDVPAIERDEDGITVPASRAVTAENPGPELFHEISGADYALGLNVTVPSEGVQEDTRHTFTVAAESTHDGDERETIGLGVQLGQDFNFETDADVTSLEAPQGGTVAFALDIENTGASRDSYTIDATVTPGAFETPVVRSQSLEVSSGSTKTASVILEVPEGVSGGTTGTVDVEVTADAGSPGEEPTITRTETFEVNVANQGTLTLEGPEEDAPIGPSGENSLTYTVVNEGNTQREVTMLELVAPDGFDTTLSDENATLEVDPGESTTFTYQFSGPEDVLTGSVFPFTLRAEDSTDSDDFGVAPGFATVIGETDVELVAEEDRLVVDRESNTTFPVLVKNPGNQPTFYNLRASFSSSGWSATVVDEDGQPYQDGEVRVPERASQRVFLNVRAPDDVAEGHVERIELSAHAEGDLDVSDTITLEAPIHDFDVSVAVDGATTKDAVPGENVAYSLAITNAGNGEDRVTLSFESPEGEEPTWETVSQLEGDTTQVLEPGETLTDVTVIVRVPGPSERPVPVRDGVPTVVRATSANAASGAPTATTDLNTRLVKYQSVDVDGDGTLEMGVDLNRDNADGFEVYRDPSQNLVQRGALEEGATETSTGLYTLDGDDDGRVDHIVDTSGNGVGDAYFDPDQSKVASIDVTADATGDGQPDHPIDTDFDGRTDAMYSPGDETAYTAESLDFTGDGRHEIITDTTGDGEFDTFVNPNESPPIVTPIERDGDLHKLDTDGDGDVDTHYDAETQSISDARTSNLGAFFADYWWFVAVFVVVLALFGLVVYRRV